MEALDTAYGDRPTGRSLWSVPSDRRTQRETEREGLVMALIKHNDRTPRSADGKQDGEGGCRYCKSLDVYWYHDTDSPRQYGRPCRDHDGSRNWTLMERDGITRHTCRKDGSEPEAAETEPEATPSVA